MVNYVPVYLNYFFLSYLKVIRYVSIPLVVNLEILTCIFNKVLKVNQCICCPPKQYRDYIEHCNFDHPVLSNMVTALQVHSE